MATASRGAPRVSQAAPGKAPNRRASAKSCPKGKRRKPRMPRKNNKKIDHSRTRKHADGSTTFYDKKGNKVAYTKEGYPDFSPHSAVDVKLNGLDGSKADFSKANLEAGFPSTPKGYTWHHVEDGKTLQLVPRSIHSTFPHTGGASIIKGL